MTHPVTGLPSKKGWLPTVKEVVEACDLVVEPIVQNEIRLKRIKEQLETREREARGEKPTSEQMKDRYGDNWGLTPREPKQASEFRVPSWQSIISMYSADQLRIQRLVNPEATGERITPQSEENAA